MNPWAELEALCRREVVKLERGLHRLTPDPGAIPEALLDAELATQPALADAVQRYCGTGQWPPLSPLEKTMLHERLSFAASLAGFLAEPARFEGSQVFAPPRPRLSRMGLLEWLLIEVWECEGYPSIQDMADALRPEPPDGNAAAGSGPRIDATGEGSGAM